jgi:autotransporter-associated beta strand protein
MHHRTHITGIFGALILMLFIQASQAGNATWDLNPGSDDWNTAANWTPTMVPNGTSDTATFDLSNTNNVSISANTEVNGITFTSAASAYTITVNPNLTLTISGTGITNNSGVTQNFVTAVDASGSAGTIVFSNSATAGSDVFTSASTGSGTGTGGEMFFKDTSAAGNATIFNNEGFIQFSNRSTAGNAAIFNEEGIIQFSNRSTAGHATISDDINCGIFFSGSSTAGGATIGTGDFTNFLQFFNSSTAGHATIFGGANIDFLDSSTAGRAIIGSFGGSINFSGFSKGGTAQIQLNFDFASEVNALLNISAHNAPGVTVGSIEGVGHAFLGANNLTVGSNNLSTTFSGMIDGRGGSLTKIGTGTLDLTGANTYTGSTNINRGVLKVDGSITSNTLVNHRGTLAGTGTISGNVTNTGSVSPGDAPGTLAINGNYTQASNGRLLIDIAGTNNGQFSVLDVLGNADLDGFLHPVLLNGFTPTIGESFTFLDYVSLTGAFSGIQNQVFNNGTERWLVTYQATDAVLTATKNVPDYGSTFPLLTLSLLGVLTYRCQLLRKPA